MKHFNAIILCIIFFSFSSLHARIKEQKETFLAHANVSETSTNSGSYDVELATGLLFIDHLPSWSTVTNITTQLDYCHGDRFYDSGVSSSNYQNNEAMTTTIFPENPGDFVTAVFHYFITESGFDYLNVYDGPDDAYPLIATLNGDLPNIDPIASTHETGALTFVFTSDESVTRSGWDISFICQPWPSCSATISAVELESASTSSLTIGWLDTVGITSWEIALVAEDTVPEVLLTTSDNPYTFEGLASNTTYHFYIRPFCEVGTSAWLDLFVFNTLSDYCYGDRFYDSGRASSNYQNNETMTNTIFPDNLGDFVTAVFHTFNTENRFDYLNVYDGPDDFSPLVKTLDGELSNIDPIASTHETGALTFVFTSDHSITRSGWDVSIICQPLPSCAATISAVELEYASTSSLTIGWLDTAGMTSWEIALVAEGAVPEALLTTSDNPYTFDNLEPNTAYHFYIRSICEEGISAWLDLFVFNTQPDYCNGDHFYDSGGSSSSYQNNEMMTTTIFPENAGDHIIAVFNDFNIVTDDDFLRVYDGPNDSYPLVAELTGNINIADIPATDQASGALTFVFTSDASSTRSGWDISIVCTPFPDCPYSLSDIGLLNSNTSSLTVRWADNADVNLWELALLSEGVIPAESIITGNNPYTFEGLELNTVYHFYIRSLCAAGTSAWLGPYVFDTNPDYCNGDRFYDSGGINDHYQNNENITTTIFPDNAADRIIAIFNAFSVGLNGDFLRVYDGPNDSYPLVAELTGGIDVPNILATDEASGALTFVFTSNSFSTWPGWDVSIICEPLPGCPHGLSDIGLLNSSTTSLTLSWADNADVNSWVLAVLPEGVFPSEGIITADNPYTFEGLTPNTVYHFYIRSLCAAGASAWLGPFAFSTQPDYCNGDRFYDSGGLSASYENNEVMVTTIFPKNVGDHIIAIFHTFSLGFNDLLRVYDGPNDSYPLVAELTGDINVPDIIATDEASGALTFVFTSNAFFTWPGWDVSIICAPFPDCPYSLSDIGLLNSSITSLTVTWADSADVNSWELALLPEGIAPSEGVITADNPYTFEGLTSNTAYHFYIRSLCAAGTSIWLGPFMFNTQADYCNGDRFYDSGGPFSFYQNNENISTTIFPDNAGDHVIAVFNDFTVGFNSDFLRVYDGPDDSYPLVAELTGGGDIPNIPATDEASGALTFVFTSSAFSTWPGWDISIICAPFPDCPYSLSDIGLLNSSITSLTVTWADSADVNSWELALLPQGTSPSDGIITANNSYAFEGLTPNTTYHFYIRSLCAAGTSAWMGPFMFDTQPDYCNGDRFYDSGGPFSFYQNNENISTTIFPDNAGDHIIAVFNDFNVGRRDSLRVYDGPDDSYPLVAALTGDINIPDIPATDEASGALTFVFTSNAFFTWIGWDISIICAPFPDCPYSLSDIGLLNSSPTSLTVSWADSADVNSWELALLPQGIAPSEGIITANNPYTFEGLEINTAYHFYIRSLCAAGTSAWLGPFVLHTQLDYCNGDRFYDSGGINDNYQNNEHISTTIFPGDSGDFVTAVFYAFSTEDGYDFLNIYDGPDDSSPLMTILTGDLSNIDPIASTHETGALTFVFTSDDVMTSSGWGVNFICQSFPSCVPTVSDIGQEHASTSSLTIGWLDTAGITSWEIALVTEDAVPGELLTTSDNPYTFEGLELNTVYHFYIRSLCEDGTSVWMGPFMFNTQADYCNGDRFYDSGGPFASYQTNENITTTIFPENAGDHIIAVFNAFNTAAYDDFLKVYDGPNDSYPLVAALTGNIDVADISATNQASGALTFVFTSRDFFTRSGWDISIICEPFPDCPYSLSDIALLNSSTTSLTVTWADSADVNFWELALLPEGVSPDEGITTANNPYTFNNLESHTGYHFYIRSLCAAGTSAWFGPHAFTTQADYCNGDRFYDSGGANGNYQNNESVTTTIFPDADNQQIMVTFLAFDLGTNDFLSIYDGPDDTAPSLLLQATGDVNPGTFTSTDETGALTFVFTSDPFFTQPGWEAVIECIIRDAEEIPLGENVLTYFPNPVSGLLTIRSEVEISELYVYDFTGKLLQRQKQLNRRQFNVNMADYPAGMYYFRAKLPRQKWYNFKVIRGD